MSDRPSVWAPLPERVELFSSGERGWWIATHELAPVVLERPE